MQQNNKKNAIGPMRIKNSSWCAESFPCLRGLFSGIRTRGRAFEVQIGFTSSHWQDNIVQQIHICGRCDHFFLFVGVLLRAVKCSGFRVYWLMLEGTTEAMTERNCQLWIHCFLGGTGIDKYFIKNIYSRMKSVNSQQVLRLLWDP